MNGVTTGLPLFPFAVVKIVHPVKLPVSKSPFTNCAFTFETRSNRTKKAKTVSMGVGASGSGLGPLHVVPMGTIPPERTQFKDLALAPPNCEQTNCPER